MAYLAVNKNGTEIICDYNLYRNGYVKVAKPFCENEDCGNCTFFQEKRCGFKDKNGKKYGYRIGKDYEVINNENYPKEYMIKEFHFWDDFQDADGISRNTIIELPKGSIEKLIGRKLIWEDEPFHLDNSIK